MESTHVRAQVSEDGILSIAEARLTRQALWEALVEGRLGLARSGTNDGRYFLVDLPRPGAHGMLSELQSKILRASAEGMSMKSIAYALGVAPSTASVSLARAAAKIGAASAKDAARIATALMRSPMLRSSILTSAERDVLRLISRGHTNADIATARGRSERTVANQVASILRKTKSPSRRALFACVPLSA